MTTNLECIRPWLVDLPEPSTLEDALTAALDGVTALQPNLDAATSYIGQLVTQQPDGSLTGALVDVLSAQEVAQGLMFEQQGFASAVAALPATEDLAAMTVGQHLEPYYINICGACILTCALYYH